MVTHELRNPLNALGGWLHLLAADPGNGSDSSRRAIAGVRRALEQQLAQIDMLGQVLRLAGGSGLPTREDVELSGLLQSIVRRHEAAAAVAGHEIVLRFAAPEPARRGPGIVVTADRGMLENALGTLVAFALRHAAPGTSLQVDAAARGDLVTVTLRIDEGVDGGLSVWHAFGRSGVRLALDLYLAVLVLEAHGGTVSPRHSAAGGQQLEIRLPCLNERIAESRP